jgi:hypothetical protein
VSAFKIAPNRRIGRNSLLISLLAGNFEVETGSNATASATTQFPESLITETLREQAALARPVRRTIFDIWSPAGETGRNLGLVSGPKNSGPGADCLETGNLRGQAKSLVLAGPFSGEIAQGRDSNAPRQPSIDCGLYKRGRDKGKGYRSVDLPYTAFLVRCDLLDIRDLSCDQLIEPMPSLRDRGDELGAGFGTDWTRVGMRGC